MARLLDVIDPSSDRRKPPCPLSGVCGGCDWLFIDYPRQVNLKKEIFLESMGRIGKLSALPAPETVPSPEFGYRRRAQFKIDDARKIGFFKRETNNVVAVNCCPLLTEPVNALLARCAAEPAMIPEGVHNIRIIGGDRAVASHPVIPGLTATTVTISCGTRSFDVGGGDFFQGNRFLLESMGMWVASRCEGATLADLYGGVGFFSLMAAGTFGKGWLIESAGEMVRRAQENYRRNGVIIIDAVAAQAEMMTAYLPPRLDVMIVDPPRPGLTWKVREAIARYAPASIIYVSCNCATQARDCGFFVNRVGYMVAATALFDCYPNTHHIESIVVLKRR